MKKFYMMLALFTLHNIYSAKLQLFSQPLSSNSPYRLMPVPLPHIGSVPPSLFPEDSHAYVVPVEGHCEIKKNHQ